MKKIAVLNIFLLGMILLLVSSCSEPTEPEFKGMEDLKLTDVRLGKGIIELEGKAVFFNPNNFGVDISGVELDVFVEGKSAGHISQKKGSRMNANDFFKLPLTFELPIKELQLLDKVSPNKKEGKITLKTRGKGIVKVNVLKIDIDIPVDFEEPVELNVKDIIGSLPDLLFKGLK